MKFLRKRKNIISKSFPISILVFFAFSYVALASEISKENIIYLVNQSRKDNGVNELTENEKLNQAAKDKVDDMIKNNYFAHTSPSGITPWHWFEKNEYDYQYAGENLALGFISSESEHKAWMESPTHKKNILSSNYEEIGVAVERGLINDSMVTISVQMFGRESLDKSTTKQENNIPDSNFDEMRHDEKSNGIVLNTKSSNNSNGGKSNPAILQSPNTFDLEGFKNFLFQHRGLQISTIWIAAVSILSMCIIFNLLFAMIIVFHNALNHLRKNREVFNLVHSILVLLLVGSIVF